METLKKKVGRPRKAIQKKVVKLAVSISYDNHKYILDILEERKMQIKGHFSKILNKIITDHKEVRRYKDKQAAKARTVLEDLGELK